MPSVLKTERQGSTLVLTLSDPPTRNTLSQQLVSAGIEILNVAESDADVRAVVLQGEGPHFCAGGNVQGLSERRQLGAYAQVEVLDRLHQFIEALRVFPKPVIAAVEGAAAGAGFSLALACDLIVAAADARFILSHAHLGLTPDGGATWQLVRGLPRQTAQQIVWLGEPVSAERLQVLGVVNQVCERGKALPTALALAQRLEAMAPNAISGGKDLIQQASAHSLNQQLEMERDQFVANLFHANAGEGLQAFFDKRAPRYR